MWGTEVAINKTIYMIETVMSRYESLDTQKVFEILSRSKEALMTENETTPALNTNLDVHRNPFADQAN